jgi:ABC-type multidrug transport system fused ATPase/permease subunit
MSRFVGQVTRGCLFAFLAIYSNLYFGLCLMGLVSVTLTADLFLRKRERLSREQLANAYTACDETFKESFDSIRTVRAFSLESFFLNKFNRLQNSEALSFDVVARR